MVVELCGRVVGCDGLICCVCYICYVCLSMVIFCMIMSSIVRFVLLDVCRFVSRCL